MKKISLIILIVIHSNFIFSQVTFHQLDYTINSDTVFWYQIKNAKIEKFQLGFIENDSNEVAFRFWTPGSTTEVAKKGHMFFGEINYFVTEVDDKESMRIFKKTYPLSPSIVENIFELIDSSQINSLPSDNKITNWQQGLDGITYFFEYKSGSTYSFKNYWTPTSQDSLSEAILMQHFINRLSEISNAKKLSNEFTAEIPFISWKHEGSSYAVIRIQPSKLDKKRKKKK